MATFIDPLTVMLLSLGMSALLLALYYFKVGSGKKDISSLVVPAFILGLFNAVSGFLMSFTWPLPGSYNMLFGDPLLVLGLLMIAGSYMISKGMDMKVLSLLGFLLGVYLIVGMIGITQFGMESGNDWLTATGLYAFSMLAAIFSPILYLKPKGSGKYAYYFEVFLLVVVMLFALLIGYMGLDEHLGSFSTYFP
jgi:putative membrane protein